MKCRQKCNLRVLRETHTHTHKKSYQQTCVTRARFVPCEILDQRAALLICKERYDTLFPVDFCVAPTLFVRFFYLKKKKNINCSSDSIVSISTVRAVWIHNHLPIVEGAHG